MVNLHKPYLKLAPTGRVKKTEITKSNNESEKEIPPREINKTDFVESTVNNKPAESSTSGVKKAEIPKLANNNSESEALVSRVKQTDVIKSTMNTSISQTEASTRGVEKSEIPRLAKNKSETEESKLCYDHDLTTEEYISAQCASQNISEDAKFTSTPNDDKKCETVANGSTTLTEPTDAENRFYSKLEECGLEVYYWSKIFQNQLGVKTIQQMNYLDEDDLQTINEHTRYKWEKRALNAFLGTSEIKETPYSEKQISMKTTEETKAIISEDVMQQSKSRNLEHNCSSVAESKITEEQVYFLLNKLGLSGFFPNKLKLESVIEIQEFHHSDDFTYIPWVFMRNIMMINWTARDILIERHLEGLRESQEVMTDDWDFKNAANSEGDQQNNGDTINPLDLVVALWHCFSPNLKQVVTTKMCMCRLAIPFALPPIRNTLPILSVWPIRQVIIEQKADSGTTQKTAYECECHVVSFIRLGKICLSKSKLINQLLSEQYHDTFFNRDCPLGTSKRIISNGLLEAAWHLPREVSENVKLYLNLRGDALLLDEQVRVLSQISSVVVILFDINLLSNPECKAILQTMYQRVPGVVLGIDANSITDDKARSIYDQHIKENQEYKVKLRVCKLAVADTISSFSLIKKQMAKGIYETASRDPLIAFSTRLHKTYKTGENSYSVDENSRLFQKAKKRASDVTKLLKPECTDTKTEHIPLQGKYWKKFSETQTTKKQPNTSQAVTHYSNKKQEMLAQRQEQLKIVKQHRTLMDTFQSNLLDKTQTDEECILFITYLKLFLDDISRNNLPEFVNQYKRAWQELKTDKGKQVKKDLQKKLDEAEYRLAAASFGYEHLVRECGQIYECIIECNDKDMIPHANKLSKICAKTLLLGHPFEIMDGDAANVPMVWIKAVFKDLQKLVGNKTILVLSVLGIQSSGKSTLLNTMFGLQFAVSAGRCTRGVFVQLVPVSSKKFEFDYLLVVDTEGLRASELGNKKRDHDNKLATFVIGLGDITVINIKGENTAEITDILQIAVHAFLRLKLVNQKLNLKQKCIFIHQNVPAADASDKLMHERNKLVENLDEMTKEAAKQEQITNVQTFDQVIDFDSEKNIWYFSDLWVGDPPMAPTNPGYSKSVEDVKNTVLYKLTSQRDSFFTIEDTMLRIGDLWTGIVRDDFVYGFRNSLEMKAYSSMEKRYQEVHWDLHKFFYEFIINKAKTMIENISEAEDLTKRSLKIETELQQEAEKTVSVLLQNLESFVSNSDLKDVMSQWTPKRAFQLEILKKDLLTSTKSDIMNIREERRIQILQTTERTKHEAEINDRAIQLAKTLKGKKPDKPLMDTKFEVMWSDWLWTFSSTIKNDDSELSVQEKIQQFVWNQFPSIARYMETEQIECEYKTLTNLIGSLTLENFEIGKHLEIRKNLKTHMRRITNVLRITHEDNNSQYKSHALSIADTIFKRIDVSLYDTKRQDVKFNVKSAAEILRIIGTAIDEHNNDKAEDIKFNLLPPYKALLIIHVVRFITIVFTKQEEEYTTRHSLRGQLEEYRETAWQLFKNVVEKKTEDHNTAIFFKRTLTKSVIDHVSDLIPLDIQQMMLLNFSHQKYCVIRDIMIYLSEKDDFEECFQYISDPCTFVQTWLTNQMHKLVFDEIVENCNQYAQFAKKRIRKIFTEIEKSIKNIDIEKTVENQAIEQLLELESLGSPIQRWIASFTTYLTEMEVLPISQYEFSHVTTKSYTDVSSFKQIVLDQLEDMEDTVCDHFMKTRGTNIKWKTSPMNTIMDRLWGCKATCPFCYEPCKMSDKNHQRLGYDHICLQHRIKGLSGKKWKSTQTLTLNFCNVDIQGDTVSFAKQNNGDEEDEYINYNEYKTEYPNWYIEPSSDTSNYWMWLLCKYKKEFETKHEHVFESIPDSWKNLSKEDAVESLKH